MKNKHDEIKDLLRASRNILSNSLVKEERNKIMKSYGMINEQEVYKKHDVAKSVSDEIENDETKGEEKKQPYRIFK